MSSPKSFMGLLNDAFKGTINIAYKGTKVGLIGVDKAVGVTKQILDDLIEGIDEGQKLSSLSKDEEKDNASDTIHTSVIDGDDLLAMARQEIETQFAEWKEKPENQHKEFADFQAEFHELFHPEEMRGSHD